MNKYRTKVFYTIIVLFSSFVNRTFWFYDKICTYSNTKGDKTVQVYQIRLRQLREDHDKTQKQIAEHLGIEQTVYSRYETGKNDMKPFQIIELCKYYKVSADYVLGLPEGLPYGHSKTRKRGGQ